MVDAQPDAPAFDVKIHRLSVDVRLNKKKRKTLLDEISMRIRPGTMTLILGAPGCGKSILFKTLAFQLRQPYRSIGSMLFNNKEPNIKTHHSHVSYVTQEDTHFPTLTVRETLKFSMDCQTSLTEPQKEKKVDDILRMLDLSHVQHTVVGNDLIRGISGGQRKRVTIGVSLVTGPSLILLDEPTTGLDANTSLEIFRSLRSSCDNTRVPVIAALLQPSPEICNLFDNLLILSKGQVAYFGSYDNAVPYFKAAGLEPGKFMSDPEFLQEVAEYPYKYSNGNENLQTPQQMVEYYRNAPEFRHNDAAAAGGQSIILDIPDRGPQHTFPISFGEQVWLNMKREVIMIKQDLGTLRSRLQKKVILGIIVGTLFLNLPRDQSGLRTRQAVCFFMQLFLAFGNVGAISAFYNDKKVFYTQRDHKYYSPLAYFSSKTLVEIPIIVVECVILGSITYWMVNLNDDVGRFFFSLISLMATDLFAITFCRCISSLVGSEQVANTLVPAIYGIMVLFAGFIISPPVIPDQWVWLYYLSVFHYALESLLVNEFIGTSYHCSRDEVRPPPEHPLANVSYPTGFEGNSVCPISSGDQQLDLWDMPTDLYWRWLDFLIVLLYITFFMGWTLYGLSKKSTVRQVQVEDEDTTPVRLKIKEEAVQDASSGGAYMSWENLSYGVDIKKDKKTERLPLLCNITGYVRPGMLIALMGPSGAGKSTLLDVLANRKTGGHIDGTILINGKPRDAYFNRFTGYIEQQDILCALATVKESIQFSAENRLPHETSRADKDKAVEEVLSILELTPLQNTFAQNLTIEQRKRLTIGVELVANPQLLFLDEPTSGLDSKAATKVMDIVKKIAATGRSVICTIHQPSAAVFTAFDHLLLLKRGGITVYFGPTGKDCVDLLEYFEHIGWKCAPNRNPADFILDVAAGSVDESNLNNGADTNYIGGEDLGMTRNAVSIQRDPANAWAESALRKQMESRVNDMPPNHRQPEFDGMYAAPLSTQIATNFKRAWTTVKRRRDNTRARIMRMAFTGILLGTTYLQLNNDQDSLFSRFSAFFFILITLATSTTVLIPGLVAERAVFYREQAAGMYRVVAYWFAAVVTELPVTLLTTTLFVVPAYWLMDLQGGASHFFFFWWITLIYAVLQILLVLTICMTSPNSELALAAVGAVLTVFALFAGFLITKPDIPDYWIWLYYLSFMHYPLEALLINEVKDKTFECPNNDGALFVPIEGKNVTKPFCPVTNGNLFLDSFSMDLDARELDMGITIIIVGAMCVASYLALRYVRYINR